MQVFVRDNDVEQALSILKSKMQREGVFREMRRRRFYEKPSDRTSREKAEAIRRLRKLARKRAIRDGLIAAPVRKPAASVKNGTGSRANAARSQQGCQSAFKFDPTSASNFDPFERRGLAVALVSSKLAGIAETRRARVA